MFNTIFSRIYLTEALIYPELGYAPLFVTGIITRKYPAAYGLNHCKQEEWYEQFLLLVFKSKKAGRELVTNGPVLGDEIDH